MNALTSPTIGPWSLRWSSRYADDLDALESGLACSTLSGESRRVDEYERRLAEYFGSKHAVAVSSGTAAIHLALTAVGAGPGSDVLVPATAPLPSLLPILAAGASPVVVDVEPCGLGFDPDALRRSLSSRTRAALAVELWGYPQDFRTTLEILNHHGVPLIEDACQAHGTLMPQGLAGRVGRVGCFSTHDYKLLSTGEGGFVLTDDEPLFRLIRRSARLGGLDGVHGGVNYKLNGLAASMGESRLRHLPPRLTIQRQHAQLLRNELEGELFRELPARRLGEPNGYSLVLLRQDGRTITPAQAEGLARLGLGTDKTKYGYDLVYRRPMFAQLHARCPNAEAWIDRCIQLPCHPGLSPSDLRAMARAVKDVFARS
jgi:perosamine synthetase